MYVLRNLFIEKEEEEYFIDFLVIAYIQIYNINIHEKKQFKTNYRSNNLCCVSNSSLTSDQMRMVFQMAKELH